MKTKAFSAIAVLMLTMALPPSASAITITRNLIGNGVGFPSVGTGGNAPGSMVGGGNLVDIFNAAADWWEMAILDPFNLTLSYGWSPLASPTIGAHNLVAQAGGRETAGQIRFDNDGSIVWFADPTPHDNSEYDTFTESTADLGGGTVNTGRVYTDPNIAAALNFDLLSVAKHEIGHALGLSSANLAYQAEAWPDNLIQITAPLPNAGSVIPTNNGATPETGPSSNAHISISTSLMWPSTAAGRRTVQSGVDILANAQISGFTDVNLDPQHQVPEPPMLALFALSGVILCSTHLRRRRIKVQNHI